MYSSCYFCNYDQRTDLEYLLIVIFLRTFTVEKKVNTLFNFHNLLLLLSLLHLYLSVCLYWYKLFWSNELGLGSEISCFGGFDGDKDLKASLNLVTKYFSITLPKYLQGGSKKKSV